jgi:hypothetical protein
LNDNRVLGSMLGSEDGEVRSACYLRYTQADLQPHMRRVVVEWMLEVTDEQKCDETVFPLSVVYLDKVVLVTTVRKDQLQLVAAACMFVASKFKDTYPISAQNLVIYTDCSITVDQLLEWEMLLLDSLKWNICCIVPHDFIDQLLARLPLDADQRLSIRRHTVAFIELCTIDVEFGACPSSMIACGSVMAAANGLLGESVCGRLQLLHRLHQITAIDPDCLRQCHEQIENALRATVSKPTSGDSDSSTSGLSSSGDGDSASAAGDVRTRSGDNNTSTASTQPATPTDVRDVRLSDGDGCSS